MAGTTTSRLQKGFTPIQVMVVRERKEARIMRSPWARFTSFTMPNMVDIPMAMMA